jgi:hypothetical protein
VITVDSTRNEFAEAVEQGPYLTIVDIIQMTVGVDWIINDQSPTQAITILSLIMAVIPVCTLKKPRNQLSGRE